MSAEKPKATRCTATTTTTEKRCEHSTVHPSGRCASHREEVSWLEQHLSAMRALLDEGSAA